MNNWFNVPTSQTPIFVLFPSPLFAHIPCEYKKHLNVRSVYYNVSFLSEKSFWNLSNLLHNFTSLSLLSSFLLLVLSTLFHVFLKSRNNYFFRWFAHESLLEEFYCYNKLNYVVFQSFFASSSFPCFSSARLFRVQVFLDPGLGSTSRVWVQVLEAANAKQLYWNRTSAWVFSCKFAAYFQNCFS